MPPSQMRPRDGEPERALNHSGQSCNYAPTFGLSIKGAALCHSNFLS